MYLGGMDHLRGEFIKGNSYDCNIYSSTNIVYILDDVGKEVVLHIDALDMYFADYNKILKNKLDILLNESKKK